MDEKTEKSPLVVIATMMFLAMFIIVPPMLRTYMPKEEADTKVVIVKQNLYCEKVAVKDKKKITADVFYENGIAVKNIITFMDYTPSKDEKDSGSGHMSTENELMYLKSIVGAEIDENASQTVITLTQQQAIDDPMNIEILNYIGAMDVVSTYFEGNGFQCSNIE